MAELVDAVALGATVLRTCRFESCPRYHFELDDQLDYATFWRLAIARSKSYVACRFIQKMSSRADEGRQYYRGQFVPARNGQGETCTLRNPGNRYLGSLGEDTHTGLYLHG